MTPFWVVWNPDRYAPVHKHDTYHSAITEAERLARANPGQTFIVLGSVTALRVADIVRQDLRANTAMGGDDDIPF